MVALRDDFSRIANVLIEPVRVSFGVCLCICVDAAAVDVIVVVVILFFHACFVFHPFNSIIQWRSSQINGKWSYPAYTLTFTLTHTRTFISREICIEHKRAPYFETFLFILLLQQDQQQQHKQHLWWWLLPVSAVLLLPEFYVWRKYKNKNKNRKKKRKEPNCTEQFRSRMAKCFWHTRSHAFEYDMGLLLLFRLHDEYLEKKYISQPLYIIAVAVVVVITVIIVIMYIKPTQFF